MAVTYTNALITGASSGIGEAVALRLSAAGISNLHICGRSTARLDSVRERCLEAGAGAVYASIVDVREPENVSSWIKHADSIAPLDLVFANAGTATGPEFVSENVRFTFAVNLMGVVNTVLPAIEIFMSRKRTEDNLSRGQIAMMASIAGYHGLGTCPAYSGSKAGVKAWGAGLRMLLAPEGIRVNVICPGFVRSRITEKNTCPMPFLMDSDRAAKIILSGLSKNIGLISFPWQIRFGAWLASCLPDCLSSIIYSHLPLKDDSCGL